MDDIKSRINNIIINGLLVTSNDTGDDIGQVYSKARLETLVGSPLEDYIFEGTGPDVQQWLDSDDGNLGMCTKILDVGDMLYMCTECRGHVMCHICEDCFNNSEHVNHQKLYTKSTYLEGTCDCGNEDAWRCNATCSKHTRGVESEIVHLEAFLHKCSFIFQYLCELLEEICTEDNRMFDIRIEDMLEKFLTAKRSCTEQNMYQNLDRISRNSEIDANARRSCLLIFDDGKNNLNDFIDCFIKILGMSHEDAKMRVSDMEDQGYACVKYLSDFDECKRTKESIERSKCILFNGHQAKCRITKVYNLYFMRLATILIIVMNKYCFRKIQLCHCLTETVFKKTSLARVYVLNEHVLWKSIRNEMIRRILVVSKFSEAGRKYAAQLYLSNINSICVSYVQDKREGTCYFHRLMDQILRCPSAAAYLVENGFLCKMIDVISNLLKAIGVEAGADLILIYERDRNKLDDVGWIFKIETLIIYCLRASFNEMGSFAKFKSQVADAGRRLVQLCFEFDDMQPMNWLFKKYNEEMYQFMYLLYDDIFIVIPEIVTLLISYDDIATEILELFLKRFAEDIDRISEDYKGVPVVQKIIKYCNIYKDSFSIFNISHRVFIDIFMDCCVKDTLSQSINDKVFGDVKMLMWIARPAVTTISYFSGSFNLHEQKISENSVHARDIYFEPNLNHYLQMQDFHIIQILMSHMDPELFLKYLLFNICPSLLERIDFETPISSMICSKEFYCGYNIRYLFVSIYNALVERHFIGVYENPEYQWERRQAIHLLALDSLTLKDIREDVLIYRRLTEIGGDLMNMKADPAIKDVSYLSTIGNEKIRSLKPEYFSIINVFFFLYRYYDRSNIDKEFLELYQNKQCKFEIPDIPKSRHHFKGMNNFLFSKAYSDLLVSVLVEWHKDSVPKFARVVDNLLITSMSLCLMLKVSLTHNIKTAIQKTIDFIFGVREDLGDLNVMLFLVLMKGKVNHAVLSSVVDYLMELSQIQPDVFSGLSENPSDMKMMAKECQELAQKNFQSDLQEHPEFDFHNNQNLSR